MIRLGFVVHSLQPGGIERSVTRIVAGLDRELFEPTVICLERSGPAAAWLPNDVPVVEIKKRAGNDLGSVLRLANELRSRKIDLVQSHNWGTLIETVTARKWGGIQAHIHAERGTVMGTLGSGGVRGRLRALAMRTALRSVDLVTSNAHAVARRVENRCAYPADKIKIIPNGIAGYGCHDHKYHRNQIRKNLGIDNNTLLIGAIGRLHPVKGFDILVTAFSKLSVSHPDVHLVIVGDGQQRPDLENRINLDGVSDRIHLVGHHDRVEGWLKSFDLFVNSSRSEGMSQSMVEAMSVGLPIVATDVGDASRMIVHRPEACGITCPPENDQLLAEAMARLLDDFALRTEYSANGRRIHERYYGVETFNQSMEKLYLDTMNDSQRGENQLRGVRLLATADALQSCGKSAKNEGSAGK
ncbi:glycosyltransferase [Stieleria sp. TO1_6]|uniref:glycosyltransferase n=1 Tax=Stieleria tagensis TaxID=2956795 RepID=UPI00209B2B61|nr:glycosyltransferase [Stieleria tagensis]MCO8122495.1 glycosyltransferase [Stieleria tagensis]